MPLPLIWFQSVFLQDCEKSQLMKRQFNKTTNINLCFKQGTQPQTISTGSIWRELHKAVTELQKSCMSKWNRSQVLLLMLTQPSLLNSNSEKRASYSSYANWLCWGEASQYDSLFLWCLFTVCIQISWACNATMLPESSNQQHCSAGDTSTVSDGMSDRGFSHHWQKDSTNWIVSQRLSSSACCQKDKHCHWLVLILLYLVVHLSFATWLWSLKNPSPLFDNYSIPVV